MHNALSSAYLQKLSPLSPASFQQVTLYLNLLQARNYARGTLILVIAALRRLLFYLPEPRRSAVASNLAETTSHDIDRFVVAVQKQGLCASTINNTLSLLKEFFDHLREDGQMQLQPIIRRRHRLCAPLRLPKPMREDDLVKFFKVIDSIRDRLIFLLMLRCGLRVSEVSSLTWADIDLSAGTLRVNNTSYLAGC